MFGVGLVLAIAMAGIAVGEQASRIRLEAALRDLRESHDQLTAYAAQVAELSAAAERNRLARDIHDSLGHHLTAIAVQLEKAEAFRDRDQAAADQAVADARSLARQALQDVRGSVRALRGDELPAPLSAMLAGLVRQAGPGEPQVTLTVDRRRGRARRERAHGAVPRARRRRSRTPASTAARAGFPCQLTFGDREVRLVVADDGCGFEPLPRAAQAHHGLGLAGMRERAALAGGRAEVESRPGRGDHGHRDRPPVARPPARCRRDQPAGRPGRRGRDGRRSASWWPTTSSSSATGSRPCWASSRASTWWAPPATAGRRSSRRSPWQPDVVLMDVRMPGCDGTQAAAQIRRELPACQVVMLTTFDDEEYVVQALRAGAAGYLLKDLPAAELASAVRLAHAGHRPVRRPGRRAAGVGAGPAPGAGARDVTGRPGQPGSR